VNRSLEVTGTYKGPTGHDNHTRSIVRALHRRGILVQLNDLPKWSGAKLAEHLRDAWFDTLQQPLQADSHLYFCMPHQIDPKNGQRIINYTMFEADRIPSRWVEQAQKHDLIVVPVNSCRQAWIDSGVPAGKVVVCPLGVDSSRFAPPPKRIPVRAPDGSQFNKRFVFINMSDAIERKNLIGLLRAWISTTRSSDDALLIIKTRFWSQSAQTRFADQLRDLESSIGREMSQAAPVLWIGRMLSDAEVARLYCSATHYISASRGEGFDLPMVEAAVCGLELVAPRHTSYLDYLNDEIAHLVRARRVEARLPNEDVETQELFAGAHWWEPDHEELSATIRAIIDDTAARKSSAREALTALSWENTAQRLEELIFESG
jgi:glycosyltransferase involved in cell wall biosynthesis